VIRPGSEIAFSVERAWPWSDPVAQGPVNRRPGPEALIARRQVALTARVARWP